MHKYVSRFSKVLIVISLMAALFAMALPAGAENLDGDYIVVLKDSVGSARSVASEHSRRHGAETSFVYEHALKGYAATISSGRLGAIRSDPRVKSVAADGRVSIATTQSGATWGIDRIDQRNLPLSTTYTYNASGSGVTAYIIDTGIRSTHAQFGGRVTSGYTAISDGNGTNDCNGHGTHVAGTVGGSTHGVAKNVNLVAVRVLDCSGSGAWSWVIAGVDWVTGDHDPDERAVANMSLGGGGYFDLDKAVNNSILDGVTYAIAAGNSSANACNYSPARVTAALTIAASTSSDTRAYFSNFGSCVDVYAPGASITSSWKLSDTSTNTISGTSMAAPHVAGVAALYLSTPGTDPSSTAVSSALLSNAAATGSIKILDSTTTSGRGKNKTTTYNYKHLLFTNY